MPDKPSGHEDEYFARLEFEQKKKEEGGHHKKIEEDERKRLKEIHYMRCPKCGMKLVEIDYRAIKIDKCTACEGVWLDAGELEAVSELDKTVIIKFFNVFKK